MDLQAKIQTLGLPNSAALCNISNHNIRRKFLMTKILLIDDASSMFHLRKSKEGISLDLCREIMWVIED
jgi:hypothetical protein